MNLTSTIARLVAATVLCTAISSYAEFRLEPNHPDGIHLLSPPPVPGTPEHNANLAEARAVFHARTDAELKRAEHDSNLALWNFEPVIGPFFTKGKFPKMEMLFACVKTNISSTINIPKDHFNRLRPYQIDKSLSIGK